MTDELVGVMQKKKVGSKAAVAGVVGRPLRGEWEKRSPSDWGGRGVVS